MLIERLTIEKHLLLMNIENMLNRILTLWSIGNIVILKPTYCIMNIVVDEYC